MIETNMEAATTRKHRRNDHNNDDELNHEEEDLCLPLIAAAVAGDWMTAQSCLERGMDENETTNCDRTAMFHAAKEGHLAIVRLLLEHGGADLEKSDSYGNSPLMVATWKGHVDVVCYLLEQGANVNKADDHGCTSLHEAASEGHLEIAKLLMLYGAELNVKSDEGELPIDLADDEEMIQAISDEFKRRMDHGHMT